MLIYFAAPLFNAAEKRFNIRLTEKLEALGYRVFLPQRDGIEQEEQAADTASKVRLQRDIFHLDKSRVFEADIFLFVLDGRVPDEGACVELGLAYAHKELQGSSKLLIGIQTDVRAAFPEAKLNPMLKIPLAHIADDEEELLSVLKRYRDTGTITDEVHP